MKSRLFLSAIVFFFITITITGIMGKEQEKSSESLPDLVKNNPIVFYLSTLAAGFGAAFGLIKLLKKTIVDEDELKLLRDSKDKFEVIKDERDKLEKSQQILNDELDDLKNTYNRLETEHRELQEERKCLNKLPDLFEELHNGLRMMLSYSPEDEDSLEWLLRQFMAKALKTIQYLTKKQEEIRRYSVMLLEPDARKGNLTQDELLDKELHFFHQIGLSKKTFNHRPKVKEWKAGEVIMENEGIFIPNVDESSGYLKFETLTLYKSLIIEPVRFKGKPIGVINIDSDVLNAFTEYDIMMVKSIATVIGIAMEIYLQKELQIEDKGNTGGSTDEKETA